MSRTFYCAICLDFFLNFILCICKQIILIYIYIYIFDILGRDVFVKIKFAVVFEDLEGKFLDNEIILTLV